MTFEQFTPRKRDVAEGALSFARTRFGNNGLRIEEALDDSIAWTPTFWLKPNRFSYIGFEVSELIYPEIVKIAAYDLRSFEAPVSVYVVVPLDVFQLDPGLATVKRLKEGGFGLMTVDDQRICSIRHTCVPVAQHISEGELEGNLKGLTPKLKVRFRSAHTTYLADAGQGLQAAGQIVEALVNILAQAALKRNVIRGVGLDDSAAKKIDALYNANQFTAYRSALGGVRYFVRTYRNAVSHPSGSTQQAFRKLQACRSGFLDAVRHGIGMKEICSRERCVIRLAE